MKLIQFDIAALIILCVLIIIAVANKLHKGKVNRCFLLLIVCIFAATVTDLTAVIMDNMAKGPNSLQFAMHWLYMLFHFLTAVIYAVYTAERVGYRLESLKRKTLYFHSIPVILACSCLVSTFFMPIVFSVKNCVYKRGPGLTVLYICTAYYVVVGIIVILRNRRILTKFDIVSMLSVYIFMVFSVVIGYFYPNLIIELFFNSIALVFVYTSIQKPAELIYENTKAFNMKAFERDCTAAQLTRRPMGFVYVNVSDFDAISIKIGHRSTKLLINEIATRIEAASTETRVHTTIYYLGTGQFYVSIEAPEEMMRLKQLADRILNHFERSFERQETKIKLTASVCIIRSPEDADNFDEILAFGNRFGYLLPENTVVHFSHLKEEDKNFMIMLKIDQIVDRAIANESFMVYYQPIWSVEEQKFVSAEALLRLNDETYGFINPEMIIQSAERSGKIHKIGEFVLQKVCEFLNSKEGKELGLDHINVNVSPIQCMEYGFPMQVLKIVDKVGIDHKKINLEITETTLVESSFDASMANIKMLCELGFEFSIDDFGSGYSNLCRVLDFPAGTTKLDRSLVSGTEIDKKLEQLRHIVALIKSQGEKIVAEGVETLEQSEIIAKLGCDYIQGYYYSKPLPESEFVTKVKSKMGGVM